MTMSAIPTDPRELTRALVRLRQRPSTEAQFKQYPALLQAFQQAVATCQDVTILREVIALDSGYYLLAGYRQQTLERWLALERSAQVLRLYAMQLMLFGDVNEWGEADTDVDARVAALEAEADALEAGA